jgi:hypothetical protein
MGLGRKLGGSQPADVDKGRKSTGCDPECTNSAGREEAGASKVGRVVFLGKALAGGNLLQ